MVNFSLLIRSNFTFYMANSTFYMIKSTFYIVNFEPFQNALRLITNKMAAYTPSRERNEYRLFLFFDNLKILLSTVSSFEEAERCNNLTFEDVDQAADRLRTVAETIQLLTADIGNNEDFTDAASILNLSLIKVRNLID